MQGRQDIIDLLNQVLTNELTAINEYFIHARMCENWGYERLWKTLRAESIEEMKHADMLIARILFLDGHPNLQRLGKINIGQSVKEMLELDLVLEKSQVDALNKGIEQSRAVLDGGTRELLAKILVDSEDHVDWIQSQLHLIGQIGEANYLAQQIKGEGEG